MIQFLTRLSQGRWILAVQDPGHLGDYSEPQPDLVLLQPAPDFYASHHPHPEDVLLIEVADTTLDNDREEKLAAYDRDGIAEVRIVNLVEQTIEVYREPHYAGYTSKAILRSGDKAVAQAFPDTEVEVPEWVKR